MILDRTTERLRSKHVRTLELLQQTLDENVELRDRIAKLQPVVSLPLAYQPFVRISDILPPDLA
jgi:hypothetical protein